MLDEANGAPPRAKPCPVVLVMSNRPHRAGP